MQHELLAALSGYGGSIFIRQDKDFTVAENLPFVHPSEREILQQLCSIASDHKRLEEFVKYYDRTPCIIALMRSNSLHNIEMSKPSYCPDLNGLYIQAFSKGLNSILQDYRQTLLQLEQKILGDKFFPLQQFKFEFHDYELLFPVLVDLIEDVVSNKRRGCYLLDTIYRFSCHGSVIIQQAMKKIMHFCHRVMYKQLTAWLLYGLLSDDYNEFFIEKIIKSTDEVDDNGSTHSSTTEDDVDGVYKTEVTFQLRTEMLPSYILHNIADTILFVGKIVEMFQRRNDATPGVNKAETFQSKLVCRTGSILKHKEKVFSDELIQLYQSPEFVLADLEAVLSRIRTCVVEHLWKLIMEESRLENQLNLMKDFYLLGRGELFQTFIDQANQTLLVPIVASTEMDVNNAFQVAASSAYFEDDSVIDKFKFIVDPKVLQRPLDVTTSQPLNDIGWNCIGLKYNVEWPLHILFTPTVLEKYNRIMCFLLHVKRTQLELQKCWVSQIKNSNAIDPKHKQSAAENEIWQLRSHMAFLIDNLQYYLQVDVLESQYNQLITNVNATKDFEAIQHAHDVFIACVMAQTFLTMKQVSQCIKDILECCFSYCKLVNCSPDVVDKKTEIDAMQKKFNMHASLLFRILLNHKSHQSTTHLSQLLLRLDFNQFSSKIWGQFLKK